MYIVCKKNLFSYWTLYGDILFDVGKVLYKYCTSTFPISTLTIMFMYIILWYIYEYHLCNCFVEINSIQFNDTGPLLSVKQYPDTLFRSLKDPAQSESE